MNLVGVRVEMQNNAPIVLLQEDDGEGRMLPIFIGQNEAAAIARALDGVEAPRPMTHDLIRDVLVVLGATLDRVVITDLRDKTFYAELHMVTASGDQVVSCRPSDALAMVARTGASLFAVEHVVDTAGFLPEPESDDTADDDEPVAEVLDEFREFIDNVNPEDFG